MLANHFDQCASGRWKAVLPQENESGASHPDSIRDDDLERLFEADALVANFDGHDLDSGTVAEFCFAKFLDLPAVLLRTDFRNSNDPATCPDPWNLMCSGFPRTRVVLYNAMQKSASTDFGPMASQIASAVVQALDSCAAEKPVQPDEAAQFAAFRHAVLSAGGTMRQRFPDERIRALLKAR